MNKWRYKNHNNKKSFYLGFYSTNSSFQYHSLFHITKHTVSTHGKHEGTHQGRHNLFDWKSHKTLFISHN